MEKRLERETTKLRKSWMQYEQRMLCDYLVEEAEDARINIQSILSRHFLIEALFGDPFGALKEAELRFAAAMNWLLKLAGKGLGSEDAQAISCALAKGIDNAGGVEIPAFVAKIFVALPATAEGLTIPNYIDEALDAGQFERSRFGLAEQRKATFQLLWRRLLARRRPKCISVLEPACGSANDYRFLEAFGLARLGDYTGFDLCEKNIRNARTLFPNAQFEVGNVFEIDSPDKAFDFCFVHDLFEHLSIKGMERAIAEICRVTRKGICVNFFNMAEVEDHMVRPVDDYHWNTMSMARTRELFWQAGFAVQVTHIGTLLRWCLGCADTYNEGAYTFVVRVDETG